MLSQCDLAYRSSWYTTPPRKLCSKGTSPSFVRNVGVCLRNYTASCPRTQLVKSSHLRQMNYVRFHVSVQLVKSNLRQMNDVYFPISVHLLKSSNLREINYVRFHISVQLVKSSNFRQMNYVHQLDRSCER